MTHTSPPRLLRASRLAYLSLPGAVIIGLLAAQPLLAGPVPRGYDTLLHVYRLVQLDHLISNGILFSRWAPDLAFGYGAPLFNYYAPLVYYLAEIPRLLGIEPARALTLTLAATLVVGALGMWGWAREWLGTRAGLVSAMAYVAAPYTAFNVLHRGAFAESLALGLAPLAFWMLHRRMTTRALRYGAAFTVCYAALLLSHNISALVFTPLLALYPLFARVALGRAENAPPMPRAIIAQAWLMLGLGLGLTAFFWLPAFVERDLVQIEKTFLPAVFDYRFNFIQIAELFAPPTPVESGLVSSPVSRSLGLAALALGVLGVADVWMKRITAQHKQLVVVALAGLALSALMTLEVSRPIWDAVPLLRFIQFPWRFLGLAGLFAALLAGAGFVVLDAALQRVARARSVVLPATLVALAVYGFAWQFPPYHPPTLSATRADIATFERQWSAPALSAGEYLPVTVQEWPPDNALAPFDPAALPAGARIQQAACSALICDLTLEVADPLTVPFNIFNFPGWQATLNGQAHPLVTRAPHGLIGVVLPAGRQHLRLLFGSRPVRDLAVALSACAALVAVVGLIWKAGRRPRVAAWHVNAAGQGIGLGEAVVVVVALGLVLAAKFALDNVDSPLRRARFDGQRVAGVAFPMKVNFGNQLELMGIDALPAAESAGAWESTLYWRALQPLDKNYHVAVQIMDPAGVLIGQSNAEYPGGIATALWPAGAYARDRHTTPVQAGTLPGAYQVQVVVYEQGRPDARLFVMNERGEPVGWTFDATSAKVMQIAVTRPRDPVPEDAVQPEVRLPPVAGALRLIGYDRLPAQLNVGDSFRFTLYWRAAEPITTTPTVWFRLIQPGVTPIGFEIEPAPGYPLAEWQPGDIWRAGHVARIPPAAAGGLWQAEIEIRDADGMPRRATLGEIEVHAPTRTFTAPALTTPQDAQFGAVARLMGYDAPDRLTPGQAFTLTLYWQAVGETAARYKVFVHLVDADGDRRAGDDATPAVGQRPTTGWTPGEYVVDAHRVQLPDNLPEGEYRVLVGLYDEASLGRLNTRDGKDAVLLSRTMRVESLHP